ncbi:MAG: alanine--tRNA ligase [Thermodesulfobacteriota bacterium]
MNADEIRAIFLDYFQRHQHQILKSSALVPKDDPSLLFTNAGMVQFKRVFTGEERRDYQRAVTSQKCVRAGGKHNDLENVGYTARHHTFFEMLGNFSFGDYFKEKAIEFAWDLLVNGYGLPGDKLYATIYTEDDEAFELWRKVVGLPADKISRLGEKDNFWAMGDTGPCGPCSEIIIDQGPVLGCGRPDCGPGCDCDRYLELWNLVFMQYERSAGGRMTPLPKPSIDTGMGLERIAAVVQGVHSNFETDLFQPLIEFISGLSGVDYVYAPELEKTGRPDPKTNVSLRVIADHARCLAFLIGDGVLPENVGRGYVLRRILRRAARHGRMLGLQKPFLHQVTRRVIERMAGSFPELADGASYIEKVVLSEEERFSETLDHGLKLLAEEIDRIEETGGRTISGEVAFKLYDTYGFPLDLVADVGRETGLTVDLPGFDQAMNAQRALSRVSWKGSGEAAVPAAVSELTAAGFKVKFLGYETLAAEARLVSMVKDGQKTERASAGDEVDLVFDQTPFYGAAGGQVGDTGRITGPDSSLEVTDAVKYPGEIIVHRCRLESGRLETGQTCALVVDEARRQDIRRNHTATHLLHKALREELGDHVKQAGSLVTPDRLRFDFSHFAQVPVETLVRVEARVNEKVRANLAVSTTVMSYEDALNTGAVALFEERYGDTVRVIGVGDFSMELCGGTHAQRTGDIGLFLIAGEGSAAAGVRRIEALTGRGAVEAVQAEHRVLRQTAEKVKARPEELPERLEKVLARQKELEKELLRLRQKAAAGEIGEILDRTVDLAGVKLLAARVKADGPKALRELGDRLRDRLGSGVIVLGAEDNQKALLLAMVTSDLQDRFQAGRIIQALAPEVGGKGGGRPDLAQAGGPALEKLDQALAKVKGILTGQGRAPRDAPRP